MADEVTTCDSCRQPIPYGVTCYMVPTGCVWEGDDMDQGKPIVEIRCATCYTGSTVKQEPTGQSGG